MNNPNIPLINFNVLKIYEREYDKICLLCNKETYFISTFKCLHFCCLECLGDLYLTYSYDKNNENKKELFLCPLCDYNKKIDHIIYK